MKIKNLLLVPLLSAALVATSCNTSKNDSSSSEPATSGETQKVVSRITVKAVSSVVVDDVLDFDTLVDVHYDDGSTSKDYTLEVPAASQNLVKVEGKKATILKEGAISITVKAGGESAKFSTNAFSKLKAQYIKDTKSVTDTWALLSVNTSSELYVATVHRPDYSYFQNWDDDTKDPGGFLQAQNGNTYSYSVSQSTGEINVESTVFGDFNDYYCNFPYQLESAYFETKMVGEGNEAYEALVMDKDTPGTWSAKFPYLVDQFMYTNAVTLNSTYRFGDVIISAVELEIETDVTIDTYEIEVQVLTAADGAYVGSYTYFLFTDVAKSEIEVVREYIDNGDSPAGKDKTAIVDILASAYTAKNFTIDIDFYKSSYDDAGTQVTTEQWYDEIIYANEGMYQDALYYSDDGSLGAGLGYVEHEGSLYSYEYDEATNPATLIGEGGKVYVDALSYTLAVLGTEAMTESIFVSDIQDGEGDSKLYLLPIATNMDLILKFVNLYCGTTIRNWRAYVQENAGFDVLSDGLSTAYFEVSATSFTFNLSVYAGYDESNNDNYYEICASFKDIGTTAAIPTVVTYPTAG